MYNQEEGDNQAWPSRRYTGTKFEEDGLASSCWACPSFQLGLCPVGYAATTMPGVLGMLGG